MTQQQNSESDNIKGAIKDIVDPKKTFINSALDLTKGIFHSEKKIGEMNGRWAALFRICLVVVVLGIPSIGGWGLWLTRNAINTEYHLESTVRFEERIDILEQHNVMLERVEKQIEKISKDVDNLPPAEWRDIINNNTKNDADIKQRIIDLDKSNSAEHSKIEREGAVDRAAIKATLEFIKEKVSK